MSTQDSGRSLESQCRWWNIIFRIAAIKIIPEYSIIFRIAVAKIIAEHTVI
jgi:hypothetical protein